MLGKRDLLGLEVGECGKLGKRSLPGLGVGECGKSADTGIGERPRSSVIVATEW